MINLHRRSYTKELMDADDIPFPAMAQTLRELNVINTRLGGHAITLEGVRNLSREDTARLIVCEIGCGGGDNLFIIHKYLQKKNIPATFIGIDMNAECIAFAKQQYPGLPCQWICSDYALVDFEGNEPDIVFSSLFCHHLTDEQLVFMLRWVQRNSRKGFFINDLQRHWLAYYLIKYITRFFSRSYLVKNDACLSVARSFRKEDWKQLFRMAGIGDYSIRWKWAFRWLVVSSDKKLSLGE
ncbi:MAG TPA: methyltransferase domain-containing protein [Chitinophagaceae bacterium]|nr:methyltransferase domain-containing protein [Chitinophagaceae bacterium]